MRLLLLLVLVLGIDDQPTSSDDLLQCAAATSVQPPLPHPHMNIVDCFVLQISVN